MDIGAASGEFAQYVYKQKAKKGLHNLRVIAVEPVSAKADEIRKKFSGIEVIEAGIRNVEFELKETFYIHKNSDLSSFKSINPNIDTSMWSEHISGFSRNPGIEVLVKSLESVMMQLNLHKIDFLKIGTQGTDLEVLESAGQFINKINAVVLEFPYNKTSQLYQDEVTLLDAIIKLDKLNFIPARIVPNGAGECNLFAFRKNFGLQAYWELENILSLTSAPTLKIESVRKKLLSMIFLKNLMRKLIGGEVFTNLKNK